MRIPNPLSVAQVHAQVAVAVELYTIPFYFSALASIKDNGSQAFAAVRSVCTEEMLHLQLAANACLALGVPPNFTAPVYGKPPTFPDHVPILDPNDPATGDKGILNARIGNVLAALPTMLDVETPTEFEHGKIGPPYRSIGQMYAALLTLVRRAGKMVPWTMTNQVSSIFPSQTFTQTIGSYADLSSAVEVICEQGEGQAQSPPPSPPFTPEEFLVPDGDQTTNVNSVPPDLASFSHFARFLLVQEQNLTVDQVYSGTYAPSSPENQTLQKDFAALLSTLNQIWAGKAVPSSIWSVMPQILGDVTAVWQKGNLPQWTPPT